MSGKSGKLIKELESNISKCASHTRTEQSFVDGWNRDIEAAITIARTNDANVVSLEDFSEHVVKTYRGESYDRLATGLAEEVGEIIQVLKGFRDSENLVEVQNELAFEIGDLIRYACLLAHKAKIPLAEILRKNMGKMEERWPKCFGVDSVNGGKYDRY